MSGSELRELFEDALAGEPERDVPVREDIARGRRSLTRLRRRWAGGATLVAAAAAVALVVPASPLSIVDGGPAGLDVADETQDDAVAEPGDVDRLEQDMWQAVEDVLPADVSTAAGFVAGGDGPGPDLSLQLQRDGAAFAVRVWLQEARSEPDAFRPCSRPGTALEVAGGWQPCDEGTDALGRWRVAADVDPRDHVTVLEGGTAAVTVVRPVSGATLTQAETDAVADAVWRVGDGRPAGELRTAVDLDQAVAAETVENVVAVLEERLGLGAFSFRTSGLTHSGLSELGPDSASVWGRYVTDSGVGVDVVLWQKDRIYEPLCISAVDGCLAHAGSVAYLGNELAGRYPGPSLLVPAGPRGGLWVHLGSTDPELEQRLEAAVAEAAGRIRFVGADPFPLS